MGPVCHWPTLLSANNAQTYTQNYKQTFTQTYTDIHTNIHINIDTKLQLDIITKHAGTKKKITRKL